MTSGAGSPGIEARSTSWRFDDGRPEALEVELPYAVIGDEAEALLLTGLGEKDVVGIAERLAEHGVTGMAVASLTYPLGIKLDAAAVESSIVEGSAALVHDITGNGRPLRRGFGNSGGGGQLILASHRNPELFEEMVAIAPGPLNPEALGDGFKQQARTLLERFDAEDLKDTLAGAGTAGPMELIREVRAGLEYASSVDRSAIVASVGSRLRIYVGEMDGVAPPTDYARELGLEDHVVELPGAGHPTLLDDGGCAQVAQVIHMTSERAAAAGPAL